MSQLEVHVYSTFFMIRLHDKGTEERGYNFKAVRNDDNRIEGGLGSLDELYIPINVNSVHWNFKQVTKRIKESSCPFPAVVFVFDPLCPSR